LATSSSGQINDDADSLGVARQEAQKQEEEEQDEYGSVISMVPDPKYVKK